MKKLRLILVPLIALSLHSSCEKIRPTVWMEYQETACFDPWFGNNTKAEETTEEVKEFLKEEGIKVFEVKINSGGTPEACDACHCKTGRIIACKVKEKDAETMKEFGFEFE